MWQHVGINQSAGTPTMERRFVKSFYVLLDWWWSILLVPCSISCTCGAAPQCQKISRYKVKNTILERKIKIILHQGGSFTCLHDVWIFQRVPKLHFLDGLAVPIGSYSWSLSESNNQDVAAHKLSSGAWSRLRKGKGSSKTRRASV